MDQTLRQVGELLLGSIPTIIFMVLVYRFYSVLVHKPLTKVLAERRSRTEGAVEKARADIAAAEARTAEYEQRLREARKRAADLGLGRAVAITDPEYLFALVRGGFLPTPTARPFRREI